jgi:uncharacterized spore protein YtfJ
MATDTQEPSETTVIEGLRGVRDAISVSRSFGEAYTVGDVTIIPVARASGGGGGGGGTEGNGSDDDDGSGSGFGTGFGINTQPVGVYEVRDGNACWKPAVDINRLARGGQVLAGIVTICVTLVLLRRQR